jgi:predicted RNA binding protein YcfA (HicA-like mRNA interferase family)
MAQSEIIFSAQESPEGSNEARALGKSGYQITSQTASHMRLSSSLKGQEHRVTIPAHESLKIGTISQIVNAVSNYLERSRDQLLEDRFS